MQEKYTVIRSMRKSVAIVVMLDGTVLVSAPYLYPEWKIEKLMAEKQGWLKKAKEKMEKRRAAAFEPSEEEIKKLKEKAKEILPKKVEYFSSLIGVKPTAVHITSAKTRFGSCSGKNSISFSYRLMQYPEAAVDYVVVHELCHIKHHNHSARFYSCIEKILPDYKEREKLLKNE